MSVAGYFAAAIRVLARHSNRRSSAITVLTAHKEHVRKLGVGAGKAGQSRRRRFRHARLGLVLPADDHGISAGGSAGLRAGAGDRSAIGRRENRPRLGIVTEYVAEGRPHVVNGASISRDQDMARAEQLLLEALERDRDQPKAYFVLGRLRRLQNRLTESKSELEKAIALDRNSATAILQLGITLLFLGQPEAALPHFEYSLQLNPQIQNVWFAFFWLGYAHLLLGQTDDAIDFLRKSRAANPRVPPLSLAAAFRIEGRCRQVGAELFLLARCCPLRRRGPAGDGRPQWRDARGQAHRLPHRGQI